MAQADHLSSPISGLIPDDLPQNLRPQPVRALSEDGVS